MGTTSETKHEELYRQMVRARNDFFHTMLYKDISHEELIKCFEENFKITAWGVHRSLVFYGNQSKSATEMIEENEAKTKAIINKKDVVYEVRK